MKTVVAIILIVIGIFLFTQGLNRKDSLAGAAAKVGTEVANTVDGGTRTPKHVIYMVTGGVLTVIGLVTLVRRPKMG